jgi:transposase
MSVMKFVGIDIASETHAVAVVDDKSEVLVKAKPFTEDVAGYTKLLELIGPPAETLVAMEATGHYWKNLFAFLVSNGFAIALLNPLQTHCFASEDLQRTKTDAIDALGIARFAAQKRPVASRLPDTVTDELRELVRFRDRLKQDFDDRVRQLHRLVDLGFPEFTRYVKSLDSELASSILKDFPTAEAFVGIRAKSLSNLKYDGVHFVGLELANRLIEAAKVSVGRHHEQAYRVQVRCYCEDLDLLRRRLRELDRNIESKLDQHEIGKLLTTISGIGPHTAARLIATVGNPADFRDERAFAAYVGAVSGLKHSGMNKPSRAALTPIGNSALRAKLYMPTLTAVKRNPWLRAFYERLIAKGKLPKVALLAAMRKLLTAIYSVAKNRRPFTPNLLPAEAQT